MRTRRDAGFRAETSTITAAAQTILPGTAEYVLCLHSDATGTASSWTQSTGSGTIYSYSTMRGPTPVWAMIVPYAVGFVKMDDGYTLFAQLDGDLTPSRSENRLRRVSYNVGSRNSPYSP